MSKAVSQRSRGYFGLVCYAPKTGTNVGTLLRSAHVFGAAFVATVGRRYQRQASDVTKCFRHIPLWHFADEDDFWQHIPYECQSVAVEIHRRSRPLTGFLHPERAVYLLGPEDGSLPESWLDRAAAVVELPGKFCLNLAVAGSIVMHDRIRQRA